ncbi:MAG TPA: hypothetical protein VKT29_10405 [Terriglobales bacterium]|nr:hypothetical protein [Terriglobales bacterium]
MTSQADTVEELELKYCEQCGGLWLRSRGSKECYCAGCARFLAELPPRRRDNRRRDGSGPLRRRLRRQYREPGMEPEVLQCALAAKRREEQEMAAQPAWAEAELPQEAGAYDHD